MEGKQPIKSYRDLIVWQKSYALARKILAISRNFPNNEESRIIKRQIIRSAISIPANIAEGFGGNKGKVFKNSLTIARREAGETDYWLLLCFEEGYINEDIYKDVGERISGSKGNAFINHFKIIRICFLLSLLTIDF
ncbi:MAG: four helix bundle protein [Deltaproteobacteria bacterium]|nr:four helix bundle protein [Deltaproteobacteria bacterium]